jgi:hypothetical protein
MMNGSALPKSNISSGVNSLGSLIDGFSFGGIFEEGRE